MLLSKIVIVNWNPKIKKWYEEKGYKFTKWGDTFEVKVADLTLGSGIKVNVKCDCKDCKTSYLKPMAWNKYLASVRENGTYYCQRCALKLFGKVNEVKTKLQNGKSFERWCIENNRQDVLDRWDYELNGCRPSEILYSSNCKKYYFKCPRELHKSELKNLGNFSQGHDGVMECKQCNSFAQWGIDNICSDFLEKYWDYEKNLNINPLEIAKAWHNKVWIKCQEKDYHGSYDMSPKSFVLQNQRCPECQCSKGEDKISTIFINDNFIKISQNEYDKLSINNKQNNKYYIPQKEFKCLIGLGGGNLSYDFYLPKYNLLIEYQGEMHERFVKGIHKSKKDFEKQQEHDRRKKKYAQQNGYNLLEIWYYDFDKIEEILIKELNKLSEVAS